MCILILLLGSGDSGKSTILKQMRLIHACGFSKIERENFRIMILTNMLGSMQALLEGMHNLKLTFENESNWVRKRIKKKGGGSNQVTKVSFIELYFHV